MKAKELEESKKRATTSGGPILPGTLLGWTGTVNRWSPSWGIFTLKILVLELLYREKDAVGED